MSIFSVKTQKVFLMLSHFVNCSKIKEFFTCRFSTWCWQKNAIFLYHLVKPFKWKDGWKMQISSEKKIPEILAFFAVHATRVCVFSFYDDKIQWVESHWVTAAKAFTENEFWWEYKIHQNWKFIWIFYFTIFCYFILFL